MDKKSKIIITVLFVLIMLSIFFTYIKSFIQKDFDIIEEEISLEE